MLVKTNKDFKCFSLFLFLFIFTSINKEFLFFGLDLRYLLTILSVFCIFVSNSSLKKISYDKNERNLFVFFIYCFISVYICLQNKDIVIIYDKLFNQFILYFNNFLAFIVIFLNKKYISIKKISNYYLISMVFLSISILLLFYGQSISNLFYSQVPGVYVGNTHINLLGMNMRFAGFADDPNYATLFSLTGILLFIYFRKYNKKFFTIFSIFICIYIYILSFSKTMTIGFLFILITYFIIKKMNFNKKSIKIIYWIIIIMFFIIPFVVLNVNLFNDMDTISTRYNMWKVAESMFYTHPILGNGLTSFRCIYNELYNGSWYVQSHSTYFQLFAEQGLIGILLFVKYIISVIKRPNDFTILMILMYLFFSINFESVYLQFFIILTYLPKVMTNQKITM